ncbi:MAG: hypothetical protein K6G19_02465 [Lachnospiraceae bacterium]|nr:hypothetical protein [Lachnospiraceae bacterium]
MSKELEKLENMAKMKCITDHEQIERIIKYILSLPFSFFQKDEARYRYLRDDFCIGFNLCQGYMNEISLEDVLVLIGYEPGNAYFNPPDAKKMLERMGKKFNAAGDSYVLALLINSLSKKNIHIKEFTHIELSAYTDYLREKVEDEYKNSLIPFSTCSDILHKIEAFKHKACEYMSNNPRTRDCKLANGLTMGDLISKALTTCGRSWTCSVKPLEMYCSEIIESYDLLNMLFMDSVRMPLIRKDRERFQEIITRYRDYSMNKPVNIDYETCYEHVGIIKQ